MQPAYSSLAGRMATIVQGPNAGRTVEITTLYFSPNVDMWCAIILFDDGTTDIVTFGNLRVHMAP